ncbi:hypothetical protein [Nonomuraea endophytica]|uniref:Uncharacterized protein n=1 Tax=Nonomuraea endophytica TaxID=714136 RepID=A0A7W8A869_9ACTN|nr:hypothetical protein [Nonomuraea endophytica]MBB5081407.1 hypothetical protein [Nonomuraea endophytica]
MSQTEMPTKIYFVTGVHPKGRLYSNTGPLKLSLLGHASTSRRLIGAKVWQLDTIGGGWRDITRRFITEEGHRNW